jgi:alkanesulfonate monooxygenase SsuD/methylene tetrahydromethanopterin reductase-like flavin-dependent oxidoreductase (luciferase family)
MVRVGSGGLGHPPLDVPERLRRLGETLQIIRGMMSSDGFSFEGKYYRVSSAF